MSQGLRCAACKSLEDHHLFNLGAPTIILKLHNIMLQQGANLLARNWYF